MTSEPIKRLVRRVNALRSKVEESIGFPCVEDFCRETDTTRYEQKGESPAPRQFCFGEIIDIAEGVPVF